MTLRRVRVLVVVGIIVGVALMLLWWRHGHVALSVAGGSMSPAMEPGDIAIVALGERASVRDIVLYNHGGGLVLHRVVGVARGGLVTRGDANPVNDLEPVPDRRVLGRVVAVVPSGRLVGALDRRAPQSP